MECTPAASHLKPAVQHHVKDELGNGVGVLARTAHDHHGLLSISLQVSVSER